MATTEEKIKAIDARFRHNSKQWNAARWIVRQDHEITTDERKALVKEIPIKPGSLTGLLTELRKMGLYPPQKTSGMPKQLPIPEKPQETSRHAPEVLQPSLEYVTKEDFESQFDTLRKSTNETLETLTHSVNYLASLMSGEAPSNPDELASVIRGEAPSNPSEYEEDIDVMPPGEMFIQDGSRNKQSIWVKPKTEILYDATKDGRFGDYPGTRETDPFSRWKKDNKLKLTWSDFFNIIVDEFYQRLYNADIELTTRRRL